MEAGGSNNMDFSLPRIAERSFAMATPVKVTFVMDDTTFDHTFACTPDYGELWKTLCNRLHVDATSPVAFMLHMDDVLLTNRNTLDLFKEAIHSATTAPAVALTVTKHAPVARIKNASMSSAPQRRRLCCKAFPHALYIFGLLCVTGFLHQKIKRQEDTMREDTTTIESLTDSIEAAQQQHAHRLQICNTEVDNLTVTASDQIHPTPMAQWEEEKTQHMATINSLKGTMTAMMTEHANTFYECTSRVFNLTGMLVENEFRARKQDVDIRSAAATLKNLDRVLAGMRQQSIKEKSACAERVSGATELVERSHDRLVQLSVFKHLQDAEMRGSVATIGSLTGEVAAMKANSKPLAGCYKWICDGI